MKLSLQTYALALPTIIYGRLFENDRRLEPGKTWVCHLEDDGSYTKLWINLDKAQQHVDDNHGDGYLGDPVPGTDFQYFDSECNVVCRYGVGERVPDTDYYEFDSACNAVCVGGPNETVPDLDHHVFDDRCCPTCNEVCTPVVSWKHHRLPCHTL